VPVANLKLKFFLSALKSGRFNYGKREKEGFIGAGEFDLAKKKSPEGPTGISGRFYSMHFYG
jgi:hypothetical protein